MLEMILRRLLVATILAIGFVATAVVARAEDPDDMSTIPAAPDAVVKHISVGLNKSVVIDLPRDARDVLVSNPDVAVAVMRTPRRMYLTGTALGGANIMIFDRAGQQIVNLDLSVEYDGTVLSDLLLRLIPDSDIRVEMVNGNVVLSGSVRNAADARKAQDIAEATIDSGGKVDASAPAGQSNTGTVVSNSKAQTDGSGTTITSTATNLVPPPSNNAKVINLLTIEGEDQVHLKVTVAEVERSVAKQLGIDLTAAYSNGGFVSSIVSDNPFLIAGKALSATAVKADYTTKAGNKLGGTLRTLEETGMIRTLAEPTLSAVSGESASFLAGGEFPVPNNIDPDTGIPAIEFKPFGISLSFSPVVLSAGRISLHVKTEVSELSSEGAVSLGGISVPSLKVRRAESTVELPSGGAMVLGGLLKDSVRQSIAGFPGLKQLPVLGTLFRSRDFQRSETELVIIVTPYLVHPTSPQALARPDDGFAVPSDAQANFLGRINRVYGVVGKPEPAGAYRGTFGFIFE